jgi:hypothetical protein
MEEASIESPPEVDSNSQKSGTDNSNIQPSQPRTHTSGTPKETEETIAARKIDAYELNEVLGRKMKDLEEMVEHERNEIDELRKDRAVSENLDPGRQEEEINAVTDQIKSAERRLISLEVRRYIVFGIYAPLFIIMLFIITAYESIIYHKLLFSNMMPPLDDRSENLYRLLAQTPSLRILIIWTILIGIFTMVYYSLSQSPLNQVKRELNGLEDRLRVIVSETVQGRISYLRGELFNLTAKTAKAFFDNNERYEQASIWRTLASDALDSVQTVATTTHLSNVQTYLNSLNELINREIKEQKEQRYWQIAAIFIIVLYTAGLLSVIFYTDVTKSNTPTPIFGVPLSVIMWGAAGSLAAILYRFYTEQGRIRFASEFRWLIARPIIGIIMGAVVYLAVISGLALLGATTSSNNGTIPAQESRIEVYWVIAFLAGFSDKFYLGVIDLLVARTIRSEDIDNNRIITEKERTQKVS